MYPNPAVGSFTIESSEAGINISVLGTNGQLFFSASDDYRGRISIDCSGFQTGVYFIRVSGGKKVEMRKVVVAR